MFRPIEVPFRIADEMGTVPIPGPVARIFRIVVVAELGHLLLHQLQPVLGALYGGAKFVVVSRRIVALALENAGTGDFHVAHIGRIQD